MRIKQFFTFLFISVTALDGNAWLQAMTKPEIGSLMLRTKALLTNNIYDEYFKTADLNGNRKVNIEEIGYIFEEITSKNDLTDVKIFFSKLKKIYPMSFEYSTFKNIILRIHSAFALSQNLSTTSTTQTNLCKAISSNIVEQSYYYKFNFEAAKAATSLTIVPKAFNNARVKNRYQLYPDQQKLVDQMCGGNSARFTLPKPTIKSTTRTSTTTKARRFTTRITTTKSTFVKAMKRPGLNCPDKIIVTGTDATVKNIDGVYVKTNEARRGMPVWHNENMDRYIFASTDSKWLVVPSDSYKKDTTISYAYAHFAGSKSCPTDLVYNVYSNYRWITATSLSVKPLSG